MTLLELMIAVAIIGVLASIAIPYYRSYQENAKYIATVESLRRISDEIEGFNMLWKRLPTSLAEIGVDSFRDPWGNTYRYLDMTNIKGKGPKRKDGATNPVNTDFDLYSVGPDGETKLPFTAKVSFDDIVRAKNGEFIGWVKDFSATL